MTSELVQGTGPVVDAELLTDDEYLAAKRQRLTEARPIVPAWLSNREQRVNAATWAVQFAWHRIRFHSLRAPVYVLRLATASPRGAVRALTNWGRWAFDAESRPLRTASLQAFDADTYLRLCGQRHERVRLRLVLSAVGAVAGGGSLAVMDTLWRTGWLLIAPTAVLGLGLLGRRADKPIATAAVLSQETTRLTPDVVMRAFAAAGLAKETNQISFAQPIQRDGRGWLAIVDLPFGKTFIQAASKREALASGLNVNAVTVFLDPDVVSARRVRLWVSDIDVFAQKPVVSPLEKAERFDFWQPVPFGVDARDRLVTLPLIWSSLLVGAIPRMGKTFSARIPAAAAALDPHVRLYIFNGKGDAAWRPFERLAHVYGSGVRDEVVGLLVSSLRELVADMNARFERMATLPTDVCPDAKLTPALARNRRLNMPLTMLAMDEVQRYLEHPEHGDEILALLTDLAKVGPAAGIMLVLATQKPDSKVIPDSLRGQLGTRFAMRVMTWQASETILGAGTYAAGMDASKFLSRHKGVGILLGADDGDLAERGGQTVRTHLLGGEALDAICARGRALREAEKTLTGMASGEVPVTNAPVRVLDDLASVFGPGEDKAWSDTLLTRLAERNPSAYDGWSPTQLAVALKSYGVTPSQVWATSEGGKSANKRGYLRTAVFEALAARLNR
ncbi:cell division protein FtsK [Amycolatopsis sp. NPDC004079]|uniref:cell division protein FtsK n=1 Tax=Amycolatopsis sp. NPDC004079 TaxID=3154549 RepID=UPI0033B9B496